MESEKSSGFEPKWELQLVFASAFGSGFELLGTWLYFLELAFAWCWLELVVAPCFEIEGWLKVQKVGFGR